MTNQEILKKVIEKSQENKYSLDLSNDNLYWLKTWLEGTNFLDFPYEIIIFSHDFAKLFWGEANVCLACGKDVLKDSDCWANDDTPEIKEWEYHLQQMVLEKEPLKYLEKFL